MKKAFLLIALISGLGATAQQFCFITHAQYPNLSGNSNMFGLCKGDFNNDGILDLAVTNTGSGSVTVFRGLGGGNFVATGAYPCGSTPHQIVASDLNNDGFLDLATANFGGGNNFSVLLNDGTGAFPPMSNVTSGSGVKSITSADFNNDGNMDIAVVNSGNGSYSAFLGNGLGAFSLSQNTNIGGAPYGICSADFNEDGNQDLVTVKQHEWHGAIHAGPW